MLNVTEPIRRVARIVPDAAAIIRADHSVISYAQLDRAIDAMARRSLSLGLQPGDIVELAITGPDETLGVVMALALARIAVASADPGVPAERLRHRFQRIDPSWLELQSSAAGEPVAIDRDPARLCRIIASSGTTGRPKLVPLSHEVMARRVLGRMIAEGGAPEVRMIALGLGGGFGFAMLLRTLWMRGTLVLANPATAATALRRHGVTSIVASPHALAEILRSLPAKPEPFPALRVIEAGGSHLPSAVVERLRAQLCEEIVLAIGSAEVGPYASAPMSLLESRPGATGFLWPGVDAVAVDDAGQALPGGQEGRLRVRSPGAAPGYLLVADSSEESFIDGWFQSNDIGAVWPDGMVTITGRASELINSGGVKVAPERIERLFMTYPGVTDVAAFGVPDESGVERIWVAVVAGKPLDTAELGAFCAKASPAFAPEVILQVAALPRNINGKIQRDALLRLARTIESDGAPRGD